MNIQQAIIRIRQLDKDLIPEALEDLARYRAIATACTPRYENDGTQHTENGNSKERAFVECAESSRKVDMLKDELVSLTLEVEAFFNKSLDGNQRRIAKLYYIDSITQPEIAAKTNYALSTIKNSFQKINKILNIVP
jgi:DNA-directed RNA polymerase specialized sigma subunit